MCGIAGVLYADRSRPVDRHVLQGMADSLAHRGPDGEGFWTESGIGLAHRRLSVIDLAGGQQPMANEDGSIRLIFNGEIYNYRQLRAGLEGRGHIFHTQSDTETLVHLYEEHGDQLVDHLRGMFAFALWDSRRRKLLLGRDRVGINPLYIYRDDEKVVFGSEIKAILAHPDVERAIDIAALEEYFAFGMVPGRRSIFRRIEKLPPAHVVTIRPDVLDASPRRYWQWRIAADSSRSVEDWQEAVRSKVEDAVQAHLVADVPVGAFLSGGVDSSVVVAVASRLNRDPLQTFSVGFQEQAFSELPYARQVAEQYGTRHTEEIVTADAARLLDRLTFHYDEPFADSSALPTFLVAQLARRHVKVVVSGDGGDEAFGGYARYAHDLKEAAIRRWLPGWFRRSALAPLAGVWPKADWLPRPLRAKTLLTNLSLEAGSAYANTLAWCRQPLRRQLLAGDIAAELNGQDPEAVIRSGHALAPAGDDLGGMIAADIQTILPDDFLVKVDRASMAFGLEVRPPLLDHELLELAGQIPSALKVRNGETKWIFKRAFAKELPEAVVNRPKQGFEIPLDDWLRKPLRDQFEAAVLPANAKVAELINQATARKLYRAHLAGTGRHGSVLWSLLVLARWADRYLSSREPVSAGSCP